MRTAVSAPLGTVHRASYNCPATLEFYKKGNGEDDVQQLRPDWEKRHRQKFDANNAKVNGPDYTTRLGHSANDHIRA